METAAIHGQIAPSAAEIKAQSAADGIAIQAGSIRRAPVAFKETALQIALEHGVDHACDGIGSIDGRSTVAQDFNPANAAGCNLVGVGADYGHQQFGLETGV